MSQCDNKHFKALCNIFNVWHKAKIVLIYKPIKNDLFKSLELKWNGDFEWRTSLQITQIYTQYYITKEKI
jgi:hypothetical protein